MCRVACNFRWVLEWKWEMAELKGVTEDSKQIYLKHQQLGLCRLPIRRPIANLPGTRPVLWRGLLGSLSETYTFDDKHIT